MDGWMDKWTGGRTDRQAGSQAVIDTDSVEIERIEKSYLLREKLKTREERESDRETKESPRKK